MSGNIFGDIFKVMIFGESHGKAIGCVIEGCPAGIYIDLSFIQACLDERRPGRSCFVSPRKEQDSFEIISGTYEGYSTGAPLTFIISNRGHDSKPYEPLSHLYRIGHANYTYLVKYGIYDPRGGGRASARETACRVIAGAVAMLILQKYDIGIEAHLTSMGHIQAQMQDQISSDIFCLDVKAEAQMKDLLTKLIAEGDSIGGIVSCRIKNLPIGLGDPIFDRFEASLAFAMLSIPATKGFEIGEGFKSSQMNGSEFNDAMHLDNQEISFKTNHAGGTLGGITSGQDVYFRVAFKPTSSIKKAQHTLNLDKKEVIYQLDASAKHDPCVAIRGVCVVKAMASLVTVDAILKRKIELQTDVFKQTFTHQ